MDVLVTNLVLLLIGIVIGYALRGWGRRATRSHTIATREFIPLFPDWQEPRTDTLPIVHLWMARACEDSEEEDRLEVYKQQRQGPPGPEESAV